MPVVGNLQNAVAGGLQDLLSRGAQRDVPKRSKKTAAISCHLLPSQSSRGNGAKSAPSHGTFSAAQSWPDGTSAKWIRYRR